MTITPQRRVLLAVACAVVLAACTSAPVPESPGAAGPSGSVSASPSQTPRPLTLIDLAPGLTAPQQSFALPRPGVGEPGPSVTLALADGTSSAQWSQTNLGLSFEMTDLADPRWDPAAGYLDELVGALDRPSLRFGGNSVDRRLWWTSSDEPAPEWAEATVRPADLARLARFVEKTGATVTMALDLGHDDPGRAADFAFHAHQALGDALIAVAVGNEPNGFALASQPQYQIRPEGYGPAQYVAEARPYVDAIHEQVPGLGIAGPGTFDAPWWRAFAEAKFPDTVALTQHWYPLWSCSGSEPNAAPTVAALTAPWLHDRASFTLGMGAQTAARYGLPLWLEEVGATSCAGTNDISRTHAQALWTVDFALHGAVIGARRMNFHGMLDACAGGAPMSPLCDTGALGERTPHLRGQSNFLALMQLAALREGPMVRVSASGSDRVYAYAVSDDGGLDLVVVNLDDPDAVGSSPLSLALPDDLVVTHASLLSASGLAVRNKSTLVPWSPASKLPDAVPAGSVLTVRLSRA